MQSPEANDQKLVAAPVTVKPAQQVETPPPQPARDLAKPDKSVKVPEYAFCMAGEATPIKNVIHSIEPKVK